ncbi:hypothetical protein, partial [Streptomyces sp. SID8380]
APPYAAPPPPPYGYAPYGWEPGRPPGAVPGRTKAARVLLFVHAGIYAAIGLLVLVLGPTIVRAIVHHDDTISPQDGRNAISTVTWVSVLAGIGLILFAAWGILLAAGFPKGGPRTRVAAIVWASVAIPLSLVAYILWMFALASAVIIIVFLALNECAEWFRRPRE